MIPIIYPYKMGSSSAKLLAEALGTKRVKPDGKYKPKNNHLVINWGNGQVPNWWLWSPENDDTPVINFPQAIGRASNKLETFKILSTAGVPTPEWTTNHTQAFKWWEEGAKVFIRSKLNGHSGDGIIITTADDEQFEDVGFPLYTRNLGKRYEYRVHVFNGEVIDFQKKRRSSNGTKNDDIRSHRNGWIFCREEITLPDRVRGAALGAVQSLGLCFGAVDVAYRARTDEAFVFEVNTAPGLEGKTLESYVNAIKKILEEK